MENVNLKGKVASINATTLHDQQQLISYIRGDANELQRMCAVQVQQFEHHTVLLERFLTEFRDEFIEGAADAPHGDYKYKNLLQDIADEKSATLPIHLSDVRSYFAAEEMDATDKTGAGIGVYQGILVNTCRYIEMLYTAADAILRQSIFPKETRYNAEEDIERLLGFQTPEAPSNSSVFDPWKKIRARDMAARGVNAYLRCNFRINLVPPTSEPCRFFRSVDANSMGRYTFIQAEVVRVQTTKPRLLVAAYECETCHDKVFQPVEESAFIPLTTCPACKTSANTTSALHFHSKLSVFHPFQEIRIQEPTFQVPEADIPRHLTCHLLGHDLTQQLQPGMQVTLGGILKPVAAGMQNANRLGWVQEKVFQVFYLKQSKSEGDSTRGALDQQTQAALSSLIEAAKNGEKIGSADAYTALSHSLAPSVFGMQDVKKALLLQLIGGVSKFKPDGGFIRGDIHVLLMGDPGVAKSQLMKQVCHIAPRSIYTTGKGSSSSGLTAAVLKDPQTQETSLEGGALVLADKGICCIDEFDKMDEFDRSAIYEVMEQQSVSIAKAGHCSSLPARTSVLAAANPKDGRYDVRKPMMVNMNLPAALLSRFDLQFLLLDKADADMDSQMAEHILQLYRGNTSALPKPSSGRRKKQSGRNDDASSSRISTIDKNVLRAFIQHVKRLEPILDESLIPQISEWYASTRFEEQQQERVSGILPNYTTPRALLGILRLSQALARLRMSTVIEIGDFEEAIRLLEVSKESVAAAEQQSTKRRQDKVTLVFSLLKSTRERMLHQKGDAWDGFIKLSAIEQQASALGISSQQLLLALEQYESLAVILFNQNRTSVAFVDDAQEESQ